jgi:hypothetical protein
VSDPGGIRAIEPALVAGGLGRRLLDSARYAVDDETSIVAYALVALYADGRSMVGSNVDIPEGPMNRYAFVGMASELIRDHIITERTAASIVNEANGYGEGA